MTEGATTSDLLISEEVAERMRAPVETVRYWRKIGYGPKGFRLGRRVVYDRSEVEAFIESQRNSTRESA